MAIAYCNKVGITTSQIMRCKTQLGFHQLDCHITQFISKLQSRQFKLILYCIESIRQALKSSKDKKEKFEGMLSKSFTDNGLKQQVTVKALNLS